MRRVKFSCTSRFDMAEYAVAKDEERDIDAVRRSIERTTGLLAYTCRSDHWTQDSSGKKTSETFAITLTERKPVSWDARAYGVIAQVLVTI